MVVGGADKARASEGTGSEGTGSREDNCTNNEDDSTQKKSKATSKMLIVEILQVIL